MNSIKKIAVIQAYIHHLKGVEVEIQLPRTKRHADLLEIAFSDAFNYFEGLNNFSKV